LERFVHKRVRHRADAEDVLHTILVRIHEKLATLRAKSRTVPWAFQVARNAVSDHYRSRGARRTLPRIESGETSEEDVQRVVAGWLTEYVDRLPPRYREALALVDLEGKTQKELSRRLGISESGARSRVQRARAMVREMLLECCHVVLDARGGVVEYRKRRAPCCPQR